MGNNNARWLIYQCNVCNMKVARLLQDQYGDEVFASDASIEIALADNHIPIITFGIGKCSCCGKPVRPSYTLIAHCRAKDLPLEIYRDTIKVKLNMPRYGR